MPELKCEITPEIFGYPANWREHVKDSEEIVGFGYRVDDGCCWLSPDCLVVRYAGPSTLTSPRIILRKKKVLTEIEKAYGEGETVESVWKGCPYPERYGTPKFGKPPEGTLVGFMYHKGGFAEDASTKYWVPRVYALKLTESEITYGEGVRTAEDAFAKVVRMSPYACEGLGINDEFEIRRHDEIRELVEPTGEFRKTQGCEVAILPGRLAEEDGFVIWATRGDPNRKYYIVRPRKKLTLVEKMYGKGETVESVWAKFCPPEKVGEYGKPQYGKRPPGVAFAVVHSGCSFAEYAPERGEGRPTFVYALKLNEWQKTYCDESITDAAALEAKLRELGKLKDDEEIEPEMRVATDREEFISNRQHADGAWTLRRGTGALETINGGRRAIVRKKAQPKKRYLKVPLSECGLATVKGAFSVIGILPIENFPGATIIEE